MPNQIFCRVDIDGEIWILVGYSSKAKCWERMSNDQELQRFLRQPHGLLKCPLQCLTQEQAEKVVSSFYYKIFYIISIHSHLSIILVGKKCDKKGCTIGSRARQVR